MQYWLLKTEPKAWSWEMQLKQGIEPWNGVRNYQARNYMQAMKKGDIAFFYHSGGIKEIVGLVEIVKEHYPDIDERFVCVDIKTLQSLNKIVYLKDIRNNAKLKDMVLVNNSRLSVQPVAKGEFLEVLTMANTTIA